MSHSKKCHCLGSKFKGVTENTWTPALWFHTTLLPLMWIFHFHDSKLLILCNVVYIHCLRNLILKIYHIMSVNSIRIWRVEFTLILSTSWLTAVQFCKEKCVRVTHTIFIYTYMNSFKYTQKKFRRFHSKFCFSTIPKWRVLHNCILVVLSYTCFFFCVELIVVVKCWLCILGTHHTRYYIQKIFVFFFFVFAVAMMMILNILCVHTIGRYVDLMFVSKYKQRMFL